MSERESKVLAELIMMARPTLRPVPMTHRALTGRATDPGDVYVISTVVGEMSAVRWARYAARHGL